MNNAMFHKLKRRPKWKLRQERDELQEQQQKLRQETQRLEDRVSELKDNEIAALKANDGTTIAVLEGQIDNLEKKIRKNDERYKNNATVLEVYSKILKNDNDRRNSNAGTIAAWVTGLGGLGLGYLGLKKSYEYDRDGEAPLLVIRPKTREWMSKLPILRNLGGKK